MKKIVALAVTASALLAGPDISTIIDYDAQDDYTAQIEEAQQSKPVPVITPVVIAPIPVIEKADCCTNRDSVDLMGGYNFTQDSNALDDAAVAGIRYNKNIAPNTYIQLGYDRVFNSDYRNHNNRVNTRSTRSVSGDTGSNGNGNDNNGNGNGNNNGSDIDSNGDNASNNASQSASTQLDRFYLNGLYEFCGENKLIPYIFAGLGYENVRHESYNLESGGFFDAGAGLKYPLNDDLNLITEAKALKKFDNGDLDIVAGLGIGMMFGAAATQIAPTPAIEAQHSVPDVIPSLIPSVAPLATYTETTIPTPSSNYDNLDVVPIEEKRSFKTRAILNEPSHAYNNYDVVPIEEESKYTSTTVVNNGNYYIQIAALFNSTGDLAYFKKLDNAGLNHQLKDTTVRGKDVKLLLVGPYNSMAEAKADLSNAKSIEKGAFVKKING